MKVISFLGTTDYKETTYVYDNAEFSTNLFPEALYAFFQPDAGPGWGKKRGGGFHPERGGNSEGGRRGGPGEKGRGPRGGAGGGPPRGGGGGGGRVQKAHS
ncbi:MAG: hypothetical protein IPJ94_12540 [Chloroflexi bacterium]|nr:hypothetical protein [Chloroflexota bacterium]